MPSPRCLRFASDCDAACVATRTKVDMILDAGANGAAEAARDLRAATGASMIRDRNFKNAQPRTGRAHLHLDVPAIGHFAHPEASRASRRMARKAHISV